MSAKDIIETKLKPIAENGWADAIEILQLIALMKAQNNNSVNKGLSRAGAGRAAIVTRNAFIARLTLLIARCYARPKGGDLHTRAAFDLIAKDERVREELQRRQRTLTLKEAQASWSLCRGDHRLPRIKHFRDKYTAHLSEPDVDIPLPKYDELFPFAIETAKVMGTLAQVVGANAGRLDDWDAEITDSAEAFWRPWIPDAE
jgi:AbiU2